MPYVFLDPDGTNPLGVAVIVAAPTGVLYAVQCHGLANHERSAEGFLVLCAFEAPRKRDPGEKCSFVDFFDEHFRGGVTPQWTDALVEDLASIVARVVFWKTAGPGGEGHERGHLRLDKSRMAECVEAWIPVLTTLGPGILVTDNCD